MGTTFRDPSYLPSSLVVGPTRQESAIPRGARAIRVRDPAFDPESAPFRLVGAETDREVLFFRKQENQHYPVRKIDLARSLPEKEFQELLRLRAEDQGLPLDAYLERLITP